jgi:hypothetical protein
MTDTCVILIHFSEFQTAEVLKKLHSLQFQHFSKGYRVAHFCNNTENPQLTE